MPVYPSSWVEFFGPSGWKFLHAVSFAFPESPSSEDRKNYIDFYRSVGPVLPCPSCRAHYENYIAKHPIEADNTESMARWVYDLHEDVNRRAGKTGTPSFEEVREEYSGWNQEKQEKLRKMSKTDRVKSLADPHFGKSTAEAMVADSSARSSNLVLLLLLAGLAVLVLNRRRRSKTEKK